LHIGVGSYMAKSAMSHFRYRGGGGEGMQ